MIKSIIIAALFVLCSNYLLIAQEDNQILYNINKKEFPTLDLQKRIGVYASHISGYGISYQYQFDNGISLRTQMLAYGKINDNDDYDNRLFANIGADIQFDVFKNKTMRYYTIIGSYYFYEEDDKRGMFNTNGYKLINRAYNLGVGGGAELKVMDRITCCIEGGYFGRSSNNDDYKSVHLGNGNYKYTKVKNKPKEFNFGAGIGVYFAF